ncbi:MAG: HAD family hydrolase [Actinobacteria bacterium]|nr:MAG: HAD family hydrolase [Actinomycetota bacterium]
MTAPPRPIDGGVDAVLLDVGGVFHLPDHTRMLAALARLGLPEPRDLDRAHYEAVAAMECAGRDGGVVWHTYIASYGRACGVPEADVDNACAVLHAAFTMENTWSRVIPGSREALRRLAEAGYELAIVSNADGTVEQRLGDEEICQVGPGPGVEVRLVVDSHVVGVEKPDPAIFRHALDALGVDPARAVHVGDTPAADVAGAIAAGARPVLVDPYDLHAGVGCTKVTSLAAVVELLGPR